MTWSPAALKAAAAVPSPMRLYPPELIVEFTAFTSLPLLPAMMLLLMVAILELTWTLASLGPAKLPIVLPAMVLFTIVSEVPPFSRAAP